VKTSRPQIRVVIALLVVLTGCSQPLNKREKRTLVGGGLGTATGAIVGAAIGAPSAGAAITDAAWFSAERLRLQVVLAHEDGQHW
jgi:hypothetical protein